MAKPEKKQIPEKSFKPAKKAKVKPDKKDKVNPVEVQQISDELDIELKRIKLAKSEANLQNLGKIGSARGIESMFRNSYRAQLDMIALAATKANIMISLNGLLVSMLLLSGAYFLSAEPLLLVPVALFLLTCTVAIVFAVLAARPDVDNRSQTLEDFTTDKADVLLFEQFSKLSSEEFDTAMWGMLSDNDRIYHNMIAHIYDLGCTADKKFSRLYVSYNSFMVGLVISVSSLLAVLGYNIFMR